MGLTYRTYIESESPVYGCFKCKAHLSTAEAIVSRNFHGQHGTAFLFDTVVNLKFDEAEDREMLTGLHKVKDISCIQCSTVLGWVYIKAYNEENKYKEGKFVMEKKLLFDFTTRKQLQ
ncbi:yippee zinc-binding/DNA-binding /Mis18, centromere assembly-domain-containing protein [Mucor mucedo]|uniref:yippee zinc-binding/DNA-binding /Mis18, centromere assembly-domain-containing protein n=1 Tax=Mucor mucedo TaxID=29922 RepID=UPI00222082DF|nr:yippee zinc-binding/DNA-binding /Mis18, centromere assembly-domain-containing protein [Mucor mucedo]KAI7875828.1 yippee zinc-binding/DNA-binding /Mis18, centromere assembly-domain-containing protein [Mucor mucedo]